MDDETIQPKVYQTSPGDRSIPLVLSLFLGGLSPVFAVVSGSFLWPWGILGSLGLLVGASIALYRWRRAVTAVAFDSQASTLGLTRGKRTRLLDCHRLTRIETRPASVRTCLWVGKKRYWLSHRLLRVDELHAQLRTVRPDLFPVAKDHLLFRRSLVSAWLQLLLAAGTGLAGLLMGDWLPWLGWLFGAASTYVILRIAFFIPLRYEIRPGEMTASYALRRKRWKNLVSVQPDVYAAGGAEFFRLSLDYGRWRVVLDEGQLVDPVRPVAARLAELLLSPFPE